MIAFAEQGSVGALKVALDLTYTFVGDLRVELSPPSGKPRRCTTGRGGRQDNLILVLDSSSNGKLADLLGGDIALEWKLKVADLAGQDVGKLNVWSVEIRPA